MAPPPLANLNEDQLRKLGRLIYYQEVEAIKDIKFQSEPELARYLRDCKSGYHNVLGILDSSKDLKEKYKDDETKGPIAHDFAGYMIKGVSTALQSIRSCIRRLEYLEKISAHSTGIFEALKTLDPNNVTNVARLAKEASEYNKAMLKYNSRYQGLPSLFASWLTEHGYKFEELVQRYQKLLNIKGAFKDLEDAQKLKVYNKIIEVSGLGKVKMTEFEIMAGAAGTAVMLFTAVAIVWDILTSDHKIQTAAEDSVMVISSIAGNLIGRLIGTTLAIELIGIVEVSSLVLSVIGFAAGIAVGFIIAEVGIHIIHWISGDGPTPHPSVFSTAGHQSCRVKLPDGEALARQIARQN